MDSGIVLHYVVETWDSEEAAWGCRYKATPGYLYSETTITTGYLWWKREVKDWVINNGKQARRRSLRRAIRRAESLLNDYTVRVMSVNDGSGLLPDFDKLIWSDGKFTV